MVSGGAAIVKFVSLASLAAPVAALTRIRAAVVAGFVTTHAYEPALALAFVTGEASTLQAVPLSRLTSMLTVLPAPRLWVQAIVCPEPTAQFTPVLGTVTVIVGSTTLTVVVLGADVATPSLTISVTV